MGTLLDRSYISCCQREDQAEVAQPPYLHKCGCPAVEIICDSQEKAAELCGFPEYTAGGISASVPPKKYLRQSNALISFVDCPDCSPVRIFERVINSNAVRDYDPDGCVAPDPTEIKQTDTPCDGSPTITYFDAVDSTFGNVDSTTTRSNSFSAAADCPAGVSTGTQGFTVSSTLSLEDSDAAAAARATASAGSSCSSLWEIRTDDYSFTKRTSSYALKATGLQVGAEYVARVYLKRRPAIKNPAGSGYIDELGDPSEWITEDAEGAALLDEYSFTATAGDQVVPTTGTWTDADADQVIDTAEVEALIDLPHVQGWEYAIERILIELDLTA